MIFRGSQVLMVMSFFVLLILVGTIGYELIEGWNRADSFYMTIITITAVGYHEVHPLSRGGPLLDRVHAHRRDHRAGDVVRPGHRVHAPDGPPRHVQEAKNP